MVSLKKIISSLFIFLLFVIFVYFLTIKVNAVQADTLLIRDNGGIFIILDKNNVLGETTAKVKNKKEEKKPEEEGKTIPLVPATAKSVVNITPPATDNKKLNIAITETSTTNPTAVKQSSPANTISKTVDRVVAEDKKGNVVLEIQPAGKNNITIIQGTNSVSTTLPIKINASTHAVNAVTPEGDKKISVSFSTALDAMEKKGLISNGSGATKPVITLNNEKGDVVYTITGEKKGKFLGIIEMGWPVEVKMSAQTGKTVSTKQPFYAVLTQFFIK